MAYEGEPTMEEVIPPSQFVDDITPESQDEHQEIVPKEDQDVQD